MAYDSSSRFQFVVQRARPVTVEATVGSSIALQQFFKSFPDFNLGSDRPLIYLRKPLNFFSIVGFGFDFKILCFDRPSISYSGLWTNWLFNVERLHRVHIEWLIFEVIMIAGASRYLEPFQFQRFIKVEEEDACSK
nr:uncharacterized protein LOC113727225 isoform X1 [Coffea arabica]XP_027107060.1 uncharacterized protein LOC113727225 isoform X1 [Coffea arabica]XP_027107061.1 uncharacterized protein LOC113727225 isoform X1 [Coffea arabica]XP_027107063.1 uncharacterized protein LOC113727225 isoform X1 [Coffea arabica]